MRAAIHAWVVLFSPCIRGLASYVEECSVQSALQFVFLESYRRGHVTPASKEILTLSKGLAASKNCLKIYLVVTKSCQKVFCHHKTKPIKDVNVASHGMLHIAAGYNATTGIILQLYLITCY